MDIGLYKKIILIGLPCSGKSTIGKLLAHKLGVSFYDLDHLIEKQFRVSIAELFEKRKEAYFRVLETQCLVKLVRRSKPGAYVVATGGGAFMSEKNRKLCRALGRVIYLKASVETISARLQEAESVPPILENGGLTNLLNEREKYYMKSDWIVNVDHISDRQACLNIIGGIDHGKRGQETNSKNEA